MNILGKRGVVDKMFVLTAVLIISFIVVIAGVKFLMDILSVETTKASQNNLEVLQKSIDKIIQLEENIVIVDVPYYIHNDYILVGFGKQQNILGDVCGKETVEKPVRPECRDACLCLYKETGGDIDFDEPVISKCVSIAVDNIFTLQYYDWENKKIQYLAKSEEKIWKNVGGRKINKRNLGKYYNDPKYGEYEYSDFIEYGQCEDHSTDKNFDVQTLHLEIIKEGKDNLLIVSAKTEKYKERREKLLNTKNVPTP